MAVVVVLDKQTFEGFQCPVLIDTLLFYSQTDSVQTGISAKPLWDFEESNEQEYCVGLSSRQCYKVTIRFTDAIPLGIWFMPPQSSMELATSDRIKQCLEILIKHGLTANCLAVGKNPEAFFLPEYRQIELMRQSGRTPHRSYYVSCCRFVSVSITITNRFLKVIPC